MSAVACPHCGGQMAHVQELAGTSVLCPHCGKAFVLPHLGKPSATSAPVHGISQSAARYGRRRMATPAGSWLDLFDMKFEKYLTPWIIRLTWAVALLLAALWLGVALFVSAGLLFAASGNASLDDVVADRSEDIWRSEPVMPHARPPASAPVRDHARKPGGTRLELRAPKLSGEFVLAVAAVLSTLVGIVVCLLWVRVILETVIVVFNIASTLKDIDQKLLAK